MMLHVLQQEQYNMMNYVVTWISVYIHWLYSTYRLSFESVLDHANRDFGPEVWSEMSQQLLDGLP